VNLGGELISATLVRKVRCGLWSRRPESQNEGFELGQVAEDREAGVPLHVNEIDPVFGDGLLQGGGGLVDPSLPQNRVLGREFAALRRLDRLGSQAEPTCGVVELCVVRIVEFLKFCHCLGIISNSLLSCELRGSNIPRFRQQFGWLSRV
jgi:hypothetical protein